jgi:hypothetical protein
MAKKPSTSSRSRAARKQPHRVTIRHYRSRGVDVEIRETKKHVELKLDGKPIHVSIIDGKLHCQLANAFRAFDSIDELVDNLLANEGWTWTLHGNVRGEQRGPRGHDDDHSRGKGDTHDRAKGVKP